MEDMEILNNWMNSRLNKSSSFKHFLLFKNISTAQLLTPGNTLSRGYNANKQTKELYILTDKTVVFCNWLGCIPVKTFVARTFVN